MNVLITGGTGSLGRALVWELSQNVENRVVVFSRDEWKQAEMASKFTAPNIRYFLGDVRDRPRLGQALDGVDLVIHAAALKRVDAVAYNPSEVIKTNVLGTMNVIDAAQPGAKVVVVSSDKAVEPMNIYGASKMCAEHYAVQANCYGKSVAVVRYGNVLGSRGGIVDMVRAGNTITVTDPNCTRFWLTMDSAVDFVLMAAAKMKGGEIFIPKLRAAPVVRLLEALGARMVCKESQLRPGGEKLHEKLLTTEELPRTYDAGWAWVVVPSLAPWGFAGGYEHKRPESLGEYCSLETDFYSVEELRTLTA